MNFTRRRIRTRHTIADVNTQIRISQLHVLSGAFLNRDPHEVTLGGPTALFRVEDGRVDRAVWTADSFGLPAVRAAGLLYEGIGRR